MVPWCFRFVIGSVSFFMLAAAGPGEPPLPDRPRSSPRCRNPNPTTWTRAFFRVIFDPDGDL